MDTSLLLAALANAKTVCLNTIQVNPSINSESLAALRAINDLLDRAVNNAKFAATMSSSGTFVPGPQPYDH